MSHKGDSDGLEPLDEEHGYQHGGTVEGTQKATGLARFATWDNLKTFIVLIVAVVSAVVLVDVHEANEEYKHLEGLTKLQPKILPFHMETEIVGMKITVQDLPDGHTGRVFANVQGLTRAVPHVWKNLSSWQTEIEAVNEVSDSVIYDLSDVNFLLYSDFRYVISTDAEIPIAVTFNAHSLSPWVRYQVIFAAVILIGLYILIVFELVHRTVAAMLCAFVGLAFVSQLHSRPSFETVITWIDWETIGLLFGMMVMVGIFSNTGFFEFAAVKAYKLAKGNLWHLTIILSTFTAVVSAFLDNVTTILLIGPVTIKLCKVLDIEPITILLCEVLMSNIGGTATIIGDPPNIIVANHPYVKTQIDFGMFTLHMTPGVILAFFGCWLYIWKMYKNVLHRDPALQHKAELKIWKRTLEKFKSVDNPGEAKVRESLVTHIQQVETLIAESSGKTKSIKELEEKYVIRDMPLFVNTCIVLSVVVALFFSHSFLHIEMSLAWIAIIGAMAHILISGITHIEEILEKVEFATLMFFAALFILMKTLEELGLIHWIGESLKELIGSVPPGDGRLAVAMLLLLWVSAFVSAFVDNIPYMATLVPVIVSLAQDERLGLPLEPLVWAIAMGTCFGGNGTIIGASANVVAVGLAEHAGFHIRFLDFFKMGMPVMIISVACATLYNLVFHCWIPWYTPSPYAGV